MKIPRLPFQMRKNQFIGLGILAVLIILCQLIFSWFKNQKEHQPIAVEWVGENTAISNIISEFNPNDLSVEGWQKLGFTEKQAQTILKYKDLVGGEFLSKEQFSKCYVVSSEKYAELEPYILLPKTHQGKENRKGYTSFEKKELKIFGKFNPDHYKVSDWQKMGFSEKQAEAIIKYKNYLGGSFRSKEKFRECFIISSENYQKLAPYLILPETAPEIQQKYPEPKSKIQYTYFDPNDLDLLGWQRLGFSEKQAQVIINYRNRNLKGSFKTLEDVQKCFVISDQKFAELKPWIRIQKRENSETPKVEPTAIKTDFSQIDLNKITFKQLTEFGFDEKGAASFLGYRKRLGGFVSKQQILETYNLDKELAQKLIANSPLDTSGIPKYTLLDAPEDFLKTHPYFRKYGEKIIYFRITFPSEKEIFKKIKATPEEVAKMKLYLK